MTESDTDDQHVQDQQAAVECQHPLCQKALLDGGQTYADEHGNELLLCPKHYYELVADEPASKPPRTGAVTTGLQGTTRRNPFGDGP